MDSGVINAFLMLALCVAVLGLLLFIVRRFTNKMKPSGEMVELKILAKLNLQPKSNLLVVSAAGKKLLIGVSEKNVNLIADLDSDSLETNSSKSEKNDFADLLSNLNNSSAKPNIKLKEKLEKPLAPEELSFKSFLKSTFKSS